MKTEAHAGRWTLADLIDFEVELARGVAPDPHERMVFARDVRPRLPGGDERARRRAGLRAWLERRRADAALAPGALWLRGLRLARLLLFGLMAVSAFALIGGLVAGNAQAVHVIVFAGATLVLPWLVFVAVLVARLAGRRTGAGLEAGVGAVTALAGRLGGDASRTAALRDARLLDSGGARVFTSALSGTLQWGGLGFATGLVLAFAGALLVYDVRFYWEATPQTGALVERVVEGAAAPWAWAWPAARPDPATIEASRARFAEGVRQVPGGAAVVGPWWRFLLMALLVWGVFPRLLLLAATEWRQRRALAALDFQAPRHRALWRGLTAVERGAVAPAAADGALVLDVGGHGVRGADVRGFLLRGLRVNPEADHRVNVLDDEAEAAAETALGTDPDHVVLLVEDWGLSPRQAASLQARLRARLGPRTPLTWVVFARSEGRPAPPAPAHLERWTAFIDGLRDPATEVAAYAPER